MNLLPDYYVKKRYRDRVDLICVVLFAVIMAVIIGAELFSSGKTEKIQAEYAEVTREYSAAGDFVKKDFFELQGRKQAMLRQAQAAAEKEDMIPRSYVLAVVTNACPENLALKEILLKTTDPNLQAARGRAVKRVTSGPKAKAEEEKPKLPMVIEVDLQGQARRDSDVTKLYSTLKAHPLMDKVDLQYTREEGADSRAKRRSSGGETGSEPAEPMREFAIHLEIQSNTDLTEIIRKAGQSKSLNARKENSREGGSR